MVNNWIVSLLADLAETIVFAEAHRRADPAASSTRSTGSAVGPAYARVKGDAMIKRQFPTSFPLGSR